MDAAAIMPLSFYENNYPKVFKTVNSLYVRQNSRH